MRSNAAQETRMRRKARRLGYIVRKSRKRNIAGQGKFMLLDSRRACVLGSWYNATLDEIEVFLN